MSAAQSADVQSRLTIVCQDLLAFFTEAGVEKHTIVLLPEKMDSHDSLEFLNLCASYTKCMAFIDHDAVHTKMVQGLSLLDDGVGIERKIIIKKMRNLEGDKNADPAIVAKLTNAKAELDQKKVRTLLQCLKYKYMATCPMEKFKTATAKELYKEHKEAGFAACKHTGKSKH